MQWLDAGTKIRRGYFVEFERKYVGAMQVKRGDPLGPGLVPPRAGRDGSLRCGSVGRTTKGDTEQHSSCTTTW